MDEVPAEIQITAAIKGASVYNLPQESLVEITPQQYPDFTTHSIIDCNRVLEKTIGQLVEKLASGQLKRKTEMDLSLVEQLRQGVLLSTQIDTRIKNILIV